MEGHYIATGRMRAELGYSMIGWPEVVTEAGLPQGNDVKDSLVGIVWFTGQKGRLECMGFA